MLSAFFAKPQLIAPFKNPDFLFSLLTLVCIISSKKGNAASMKYALVNGERQEAKPGLSGKCDCCGDPIVAKCGDERIWHWSHKGNRTCDPWWENQTEWHRAWKGQFPTERQEIIHTAPNGEKHIADVKTDQNYVIEFQHSHLNPQERIVREAFYQNMI